MKRPFPLWHSILVLSSCLISMTAGAQPVQFTRVSNTVEGLPPIVTSREAIRYERFLTAVFPTRPLQRFAHTSDRPIVRRATYTVVEQRRQKFLIAAFTGRWKQAAFNVLGIYRLTGEAQQVWRSAPWEATYYDFHLTSATIGPRTLVLLQEGGGPHSFGLASLFGFKSVRDGIWLEDLTPPSTFVRVYTRFPFRPILAQDFQLKLQDGAKPSLMFSASDQEYQLAGSESVRPTIYWRFDRAHNRFERVVDKRSWRAETSMSGQ